MDSPTPTKPRGQESMTDFVAAMEKAGLLVRITDEKRVDELPMLMEQNYQKAVFVENIQGSDFAFLGNAWSLVKGAPCQSQGRRMIGITLASPLSWRSIARLVSMSQQ